MRLLIMFILAIIVASACSPQSSTDSNATLEPGNAERGAALFTEPIGGAPACSTCHTVDGSVLVGPTLLDFSEHAQEHAGDVTIEEYAHTSILDPGDYLVSGFANVMFAQYGRYLSEQQIADLIAYLLTL